MKRLTALFTAVALCLSLGLTALAAPVAAQTVSQEAQDKAEALKTLGLFQGSDKGFELERKPTRMEAVILLIRLLGQEEQALSQDWAHPFTDAPNWYNADRYLGYAYQKGLTTGVSATTFDPQAAASAQMVLTFTLRALGYTDGDTPNQVWNQWQTLGSQAGLLPEGVDTKNFLRADAVLVLYAALSAEMQGQELPMTLSKSLMNAGVFAQKDLDAAKVQAGVPVDVKTSSLASIMAAVYKNVDQDHSYMHLATTEMTQDNVQYYLGLETLKMKEGLASEPMMTARAHSVCLVRLEDGVDVEKAKADILKNVNPRKWICVGVEPENVKVANIGSLVILVMDNDNAQGLIDSFLALEKKG